MNVASFTTAADLADVSVVVLSHNRRDDLTTNLAGLTRLSSDAGCELIVVDNASTDGSPEMIRRAIEGSQNARLITNGTNLGVAGGRNVGWRAATRDYILNVDDDITVSVEAVHAMVRVLRTREHLGVVSPRIVDSSTGTNQYSYGNQPAEIGNFQGACHMIRRSLAAVLGYNDEACSFGGEELDLSIAVRAAGYGVLFTPYATVLHHHQVRIGQDSRSRRQLWLYNYVRIHHKHFPPRDAWLFSLRCLVGHLVSGVRAHGPLFTMTLIGAATRGVRDGRHQYRPIPDHVVRFYRNPDLRPEFGNVPIWRKLILVWRRQLQHQSVRP